MVERHRVELEEFDKEFFSRALKSIEHVRVWCQRALVPSLRFRRTPLRRPRNAQRRQRARRIRRGRLS